MLRCLLVVLIGALMVGCADTGAPSADNRSAPPVRTGDSATQLVSLKVPTMHCPVACWPKVKETLEKQPGVSEVTLAKQAEEGQIDNPVVEIKTSGSFDPDQAIAALKEASFDGASVVQ